MDGSFDNNDIYKCVPWTWEDRWDNKHAALVVGYHDSGDVHTSYWILKNSWGRWWGEDGYFKVGWDYAHPDAFDFYYQCGLASRPPLTAKVYGCFLDCIAGDINDDESVNLIDAILVLEILSETMAPYQRLNIKANCNNDNKIGLEEAICILNHIAFKENIPPLINIVSIERPFEIYTRFRGRAADYDGDVQRVEYRINGGDWQEADGYSPDSGWHIQRVLDEGEYLIEVRAFDNDGDSSIIRSLIFNEPPENL